MRQVVVRIENKRQHDARHEQLTDIYRAAYRPRYDGKLRTGVDLIVIADFSAVSWDNQELAEFAVQGIDMIAHQRNMLGTHVVFENVPNVFLGQMLDEAELHGVPLLFKENRIVQVLWPQSIDKRVRAAYDSVKRRKSASCYDIMSDRDKSRRVTTLLLDRLRGLGLVYASGSEQHPKGPGRPYALYSVIDGMVV